MKALKIDDAIKFIRGQGITDGTDDQLAHAIKKAINNHAFDYAVSPEGNICGLYIGKWEKPYTEFRCYLLLGKGSMLTLMKKFKARFPLLQVVRTGRHQKKQGELKAAYSDETVEKEYHPSTFKLV